jgi:hypothetical protein
MPNNNNNNNNNQCHLLNFKNKWYNDVNYHKNDVVVYNGSSYVALSNSRNVIPTNETTWQLLSKQGDKGDKGDKGDIGKMGLCGPPGKDGKNGLDGIDGKTFTFNGYWTSNKSYNANSVVTWKSSTYISLCQLSKNNDIEDTKQWRILCSGLSYRSTWKANTVYKVNHLIKYCDNIYICLCDHSNSIPPSDSDNWELYLKKGVDGKVPIVNHIIYKNEWNDNELYQINNLVKYNNCVYIATSVNKNKNPEIDKSWLPIVKDGLNGKNGLNGKDGKDGKYPNIKYSNNWNSEECYNNGDIVIYDCNVYISIYNNNVNNKPINNLEINNKNKIWWGIISNNKKNKSIESKLLYSTFNCGVIVENHNYSNHHNKHNYLNEHNNIHINSTDYIVEIKLNISINNKIYYAINDSNIKLNQIGYYRITYNITYLSNNNFGIYIYLGNNCIYPGETKGSITDNGLINHTFYIGIDEDDINKLFKIFYVNKDYHKCSKENFVSFINKKCWFAIEYIGI